MKLGPAWRLCCCGMLPCPMPLRSPPTASFVLTPNLAPPLAYPQLLVVSDDWMGHKHEVEVLEVVPTTAFAAAATSAAVAEPPVLNGAAPAASAVLDAPAVEEVDVLAAAEATAASFVAAAPAVVEEETVAAEPEAAGALVGVGTWVPGRRTSRWALCLLICRRRVDLVPSMLAYQRALLHS